MSTSTNGNESSFEHPDSERSRKELVLRRFGSFCEANGLADATLNCVTPSQVLTFLTSIKKEFGMTECVAPVKASGIKHLK